MSNKFKPQLRQQSLFNIKESKSPWPIIRNIDAGVQNVLNCCNTVLGLDFEGDRLGEPGKKPTIIGVANKTSCGAVPYTQERLKAIYDLSMREGVRLVGHSVIGADKPALEEALQLKTPLHMWEDTMIAHYLCNSDWCQAPGKSEDDDDIGAMGMMGLWSMAAMYTDLPVWKTCRGSNCIGPCPSHDAFSYCAVDAWAGLESFYKLEEDMRRKNIPHKLYRELIELSELCELMQRNGVKVDRKVIDELESQFQRRKDDLFNPIDASLFGLSSNFNPRSADQIKKFYAECAGGTGFVLESTEKDAIGKLLQSLAARVGHKRPKIDETIEQLEQLDDLSEVLDVTLRLYQYKDSGKGLKSWFDQKYIDKYGLIHPRFIVTGTSTGRLASSKPNFQNIPKRGFGKLVRRAIVSKSTEYLLKADFSQLEMRMCLYLAGIDPRSIGDDPFERLVNDSQGAFEVAAKLNRQSERDVAKRLAHAFDYMEGFKLLSPSDLTKSSVQSDIKAGALRVYKDWEFRGGLVAFTGANLADSLFGDHTQKSRKLALDLQENVYSGFFPQIRTWQKSVLSKIEDSGYIQSPTGRYLSLYGSAEDDAKVAVAFLGQGTSADHVQGVMLRYWREERIAPIMQVHDELVWEVDLMDLPGHERLEIMGQETDRLPGFSCPFKAKYGRNWYDMEAV